ncbi:MULTISPECIES: HD family phosphohydrolase [unclassified Caldibacillus]|uniref:HD family phosphohydrolase n=2 Tax=unclassified Caldibacillus TaxID=2641266 RepID=UPI002815707A|nr:MULTISPECIES: HD family phosphohydrolase [unclassified Caldibacillus]
MKTNKKFFIKRLVKLNKKLTYWMVFLTIGLVMFFSMYSNVKPAKLDVEQFSIAKETIRSPITIEDKEQTEKKRNEVVSQVKPQYVMKQEYTQNRVDLISSIFDSAIDLQNELVKNSAATETPDSPVSVPSENERLEWLKEKLTNTVNNDLSETTLKALVNHTKTDLSIAKDAAVTAVNKVMTERISANEVENAKKKVEDQIRYISLPQDLKNATIELGRYAIIQNEFYDPKATEELKKQASENVEPVRILQGQIIVEEGQLIDQEIYRQLQLLGLLDNNNSHLPFIGLLLFVLILLASIFSYFRGYKRQDQNQQKELLIFGTILIISFIIMKGISLIPVDNVDLAIIFPAAMCSMLIKILLNDRLGFIGTVILAASGAIIFNSQTSGPFHLIISLYILFSGLSGLFFLTNQNHRTKIFQAGLFVSLVNIVVIVAMLFIPNSKFSGIHYLFYVVMAIFSGVLSSVLTIGLLPFFEAGFGILSTMKLIELSNPNHPLLKKILTDAPGTYHHSVMVANLAEGACEAIGANGLLARVASYYHDIGKTKRPSFFIENQMNMSNPHDRLTPEQSRDIIIAHTTEGAEILKAHRMPKEIVDVAVQHHGTSFLKFFYHKAKEMGKDVSENDFRYPGPKPQTKEIAVISIADSVEAAVRSMANPTMEKIEQLVKNIIKDKLNDGQLSDCDLTFKELTIIEKTLLETLHGIFHNRIEYPEIKNER